MAKRKEECGHVPTQPQQSARGQNHYALNKHWFNICRDSSWSLFSVLARFVCHHLKVILKHLSHPFFSLRFVNPRSCAFFCLFLTIQRTNEQNTPTLILKLTEVVKMCFVFQRSLPLSVDSLASRSLGIFMRFHFLLIKLVGMLYCRGKSLNIKWKLRSKYQGTSKKQVTNHF